MTHLTVQYPSMPLYVLRLLKELNPSPHVTVISVRFKLLLYRSIMMLLKQKIMNCVACVVVKRSLTRLPSDVCNFTTWNWRSSEIYSRMDSKVGVVLLWSTTVCFTMGSPLRKTSSLFGVRKTTRFFLWMLWPGKNLACCTVRRRELTGLAWYQGGSFFLASARLIGFTLRLSEQM